MDKLKEQAKLLRELLEQGKDVGEKSEVTLSSLQHRLSTLGIGIRPIQEANKCHANVSNTLSKIEDIVNQFNRVEEAAKVISEEPSEDLNRFLKAMDQLEQSSQFFNSHNTWAATESTLLRLDGLLADATKMAETQFKKKLTALSKPVDPMSLLDDELETGTEKKMVVYKVPTLISPQDICLLHNLVNKLLHGGHQTQCVNIYRDTRMNTLQQSLNHLGMENIQSENIEIRIRQLIKLMQISVKSLFVGERNLCNQVLKGIEESSLDECFVEVTSSILAKLLQSYGEAVAKTEKSHENLFVLLDMYETICRIEPEMGAMFASKASIVLQPMANLRIWLGTVTTKIFLGFREMVVKDTSELMADEGVHPISSYVMNYLKCSLDYQDTLTQLLVEYGPGGQEEGLQFATLFLQILQTLQSNIEEKSKHWIDEGQSYLFLMNNIHYMATSLQATKEARELLGEDWIQKLRRAVQVNANQYKKASWEKVVETISSQGLFSSVEGTLYFSATKSVVSKRFKKFNKNFEEQYQKQCLWKVHDSELREYLCLSVAEVVVSAYRSFMQLCRPLVENSNNDCIKYTPEEIESILLEKLFADGEAPQHQNPVDR